MLAAVYFDSERPCVIEEVELAPPGPSEVEVQIVAAGVCHSDLHMVRGEWQHRAPVVLGHEGSGIVSRVGDGVTGLAVGDHVVLSWVPNCGTCR
ncbi:MAG TPA: alcohol dehydrogenase catalytic domain-containing protein, partial [Actinomycetes bacterium]|nr:alcohol dehydrogenase catalytic domain-containing protein [Actinomycetes bacterium]